MNHCNRQQRRKVAQQANHARHRLQSIVHDVENFVLPLCNELGWPVVVNERCGVWYCGESSVTSCYFKSTDGHQGTWNFSLKRLNLQLVDTVKEVGKCLILDASVRKEMPDSFSRTIPIWTAVLNRLVQRIRKKQGLAEPEFWDMALYTPRSCVSAEEQQAIEAVLDERVDMVYRSGAVVDPKKLATSLDRPLRPYWITPGNSDATTVDDRFYSLVCVSCSRHDPLCQRTWMEESSFWYTPGAADDHELWARGLTPPLFWRNRQRILNGPETDLDEHVHVCIDEIVALDRQENENAEQSDILLQTGQAWDEMGNTKVFVGTRRAGRPPQCWTHFDAVLNVTDQEYQEMQGPLPKQKFYLQMPVREGKRDKTELERWLAVGIAFVTLHRASGLRVLIHCAQGKDRSVAVAMACIILLCDLQYPLQIRGLEHLSQDSLMQVAVVQQESKSVGEEPCLYQNSGMEAGLVECLLGRPGRDAVLKWLGRGDESVSKETLRVTLQLIQQDREKASPTRSTMQKLHRFFISHAYGH